MPRIKKNTYYFRPLELRFGNIIDINAHCFGEAISKLHQKIGVANSCNYVLCCETVFEDQYPSKIKLCNKAPKECSYACER